MKKILFCASTVSHLRNFHLPYVQALRKEGFEIWTAANSEPPLEQADHAVALPFQKRFFSLENLKAVSLARAFLLRENFDLVSVHTALAGAVVRAAILLMPPQRRPKVLSFCHGYLFREDQGLSKWVYLLPEKLCAAVTDRLLVMNGEDLAIARRHHLCGQIESVPGMGFDTPRFQPLSALERREQRREHHIGDDDVLMIYAAEFSKRKNQAQLIRAFAKAANKMPNAHLVLAGTGALLEECRELAQELRMLGRVHFPGHLQNMSQVYPLCDIVVTASQIEGLPFHLMEAMSCGLPAIASDVKGHRDLIENGENGLLYPLGQEGALSNKMLFLYEHPSLRTQYGLEAHKRVATYGLETVFPILLEHYHRMMQMGR